MKRRNAEGTKPRRLVKRNKITEGIYGSTFLYVKFLLVWILVLLADFIVEFRFEYLWPFWLLIRSVYDSFKYQGLAFSVFFVFIAITSDVVCYLLIPVQWLFFAASTYVWVQYVWHTERGICLPTVSLWLLFVYIEASVRLRDFKSIPTQFQLDLCRPFAAHCIGYPVVTLGFGFKSYVSYRLRLRRQVVIRKENEFYTQLLQQALPAEQQASEKIKSQEAWSNSEAEPEPPGPGVRRSTLQMINDFLNFALPSKSPPEEVISNGTTSSSGSNSLPAVSSSSTATSSSSSATVTTATSQSPTSSSHSPATSTQPPTSKHRSHKHDSDLKKHNNTAGGGNTATGDATNSLDFEYIERSLNKHNGNVNHYEEDNLETKSYHKSSSNGSVAKTNKLNHHKDNTAAKDSSTAAAPANTSATATASASRKSKTNNTSVSYSHKDDFIVRLESDIKRLKADLQSSRNSEQELRSQLNNLSISDKSLKSELYQLRQDNENLQNKLHNLVTSKQQDKQNLSVLERRLQEERKQRSTAEGQLSAEKKKRSEETAAARALAMAQAARLECTEACKGRRREMENDIKQTRRELKVREDQLRQLDREAESLRQYKEAQTESEVLMSALQAMQEKNNHLENSLSAETRLKMDLFSALGDAKRQIEIQQGRLVQKEAEINEMKQKIAEVLAVMPSTSSFNVTATSESSIPHFSATFTSSLPPHNSASNSNNNSNNNSSSGGNGGRGLLANSTLNPNASDYTPKLSD